MTTGFSILLLVSVIGFFAHGHEVKDSFQINIERDSLSEAEINFMQNDKDDYATLTKEYPRDRWGNKYVTCDEFDSLASNDFVRTSETRGTRRCNTHRWTGDEIPACQTIIDVAAGELKNSCIEVSLPQHITKSCDLKESSPNVYSCICASDNCNRFMESEALRLFNLHQSTKKNISHKGHHKHSRMRKETGRSRLHPAHLLQ